jgi:hypothetical protein
MLTLLESFFESAIGHLFSNEKETGLFGGKLETFNHKVRANIFELFEIFREFDVRILHEFDGDWQVALLLVPLPDCIVVAAKVRFILLENILFEDLLMWLFHLYLTLIASPIMTIISLVNHKKNHTPHLFICASPSPSKCQPLCM